MEKNVPNSRVNQNNTKAHFKSGGIE